MNHPNFDGEYHDIEKIVLPSDHNPGKGANDIALLKLRRQVDLLYSRTIWIATNTPRPGSVCTFHGLGWAYDFKISSYYKPNTLQTINLNIISNIECSGRYTGISNISDTVICTLNHNIKEATCKGDSGGGLVCDGALVGILSYGKPCARGKPDVFTHVRKYIPWIEEVVNSDREEDIQTTNVLRTE